MLVRALMVSLVVLLVPAAGASGDTIEPLRTGPVPRGELRPFDEGTINDDATGRARAAQAPRGKRGDYTTPDGYQVELETSPSFGDTAANQQAAQGVVNFVASRVHGSEISRLKIYLGKPDEVHDTCGSPQAVACYYGREEKMFVPGEQDPSGVSSEYAITHEYGHHVAANRKNSLGEGFLLGAQYWATYERVCAGTRAGEFKPGDQEDGYLDNPGEGWADAFAHLPEHFPNAPFQFNRKFFPDQGAIAAMKQDITTPWTGPRIDRLGGSLSRTKTAQEFPVGVSQDGRVVGKLRSPRGARFDLQVLVDGQVVDRSNRGGRNRRVSGSLCAPQDQGHGALSFRVVRRSGAGAFSLTTSVAG